MSQFLIIYEKSTGTIIDQIEYAEADHLTALARRAELERQHGVGGDIEVVVLGAKDEADLHRSHSRYFKSLSDLVAS